MEYILTYILNTFTITKIKLLLSVILSYFTLMIWWYTSGVEAMYILLFLDFILWFSIAYNKNNLSKKKLQLWFLKMLTYSIALIVFNYADITTLWANISWIWIKEFWICYLALNEALSCLKHLWCMWVPIPRKIIEKLENYKDWLEIKDFTENKNN